MNRGFVLVLVSGVLALLAVLAAAFVSASSSSRGAMASRVAGTRAGLLARSGMERALAELERGAAPEYGGEDYDGDGAWAVVGPEREGQAYRPARLDTVDCPAALALRPTYFSTRQGRRAGGERAPDLTVEDGRLVGISGRLRTTLGEGNDVGGDTYVLRVVEAGGIHVNGGDPAAAPDAGYNGVLRRILGTLAEALDREDGANDGAPLDEGDGWALIERRPVGGWGSLVEIGEVALGGSPGKRDALAPYLTLRSASDLGVIVPNAGSISDTSHESWGSLRIRDDAFGGGGVGVPPPGFERSPPGPGGRLIGRAPVPLGWAMRRPIALVALMADLQGRYLMESAAGPMETGIMYTDFIGLHRTATLALDRAQADWSPSATPGDETRGTVLRLSRWDPRVDLDRDGVADGPLDTWEEWNGFCDDLVDEDVVSNGRLDAPEDGGFANGFLDPGEDANGNGRLDQVLEDRNGDGLLQTDEDVNRNGVLDPGETDRDGNGRADLRPLRGATVEERQAKADILKANFNPNSGLNKFNPGPALWRSVDKSDLLTRSTEFCLWPCQGYEVSCAGRVVGFDGRTAALARAAGRVAPARAVTISTQREIVCGDLGDLGRAGDESGVRLPGEGAYLSESRGASRTWGHRVSSVGWMDADSQGTSLQAYPEPCADAGGGPSLSPADWDGNLQLATVETADAETYGAAAPPNDLKMLARFDTGLDLDVADGPPAHQMDLRQAPATASLLDPNRPGTFHPDGVYAERGRAPAYFSRGNVPPHHGVISFWIKPSYRIFPSGGPMRPARARRWIGMSNKLSLLDGYDIQFFGIGHNTPPWESVGAYFEIGNAPSDSRREHQFPTPRRATSDPFPAHRWHLVTVAWDFLVPDGAHGGSVHDCAETIVDAGARPADLGASGGYTGTSPENAPEGAEDITEDDILGPTMLYLGTRRVIDEPAVKQCFGSGADATFDELAIWDFGGAEYRVMDGSDGTPPRTISRSAPAATLAAPRTLAAERYAEGRYYKGGVPWRVTDAPPADAAGTYVTAPIGLPAGARIREIRWTLLRSQQRDGAGARMLGGDYLAAEVVDGSGTGYPGGDPSWRSPGGDGRQMWRVARAAPGPFRVRVQICRDDPIPAGEPILDSPVLDDLAVLYRPAGGAPWSAWSEGVESPP